MFLSVVIPVYNSEATLGSVLEELLFFLKKQKYDAEIILVNDGSADRSASIALSYRNHGVDLKLINLARNFGQHSANLCGFRASRGEFVVTMDDDFQNPAGEIEKLLSFRDSKTDLVIGKFLEKKHSFLRTLGSRLVQSLQRKIFNFDRQIKLSNFRLIKRELVLKVIQAQDQRPYVPGLLLANAVSVKNVEVNHRERLEGESKYKLKSLIGLVLDLLFNHSSLPLKFISRVGFLSSIFGILLGGSLVVSSIMEGGAVAGWATIFTAIATGFSMNFIFLGIIGEYIARSERRSLNYPQYIIEEIIQ
jgi:glycosyltransferase involved in cell wall biosynthesis